MGFFGVPIISMENALCAYEKLGEISSRFRCVFFLEWAVPVEFKMDHVTWLWMQLGHLKSGTEDGSITVLDDTGEAMGSKTNNTGT
jgi:hypothetical protein